MKGVRTKLTEFQRNKILRDDKIMREYGKMRGMKTAIYGDLAEQFNVSASLIQKVVEKAEAEAKL